MIELDVKPYSIFYTQPICLSTSATLRSLKFCTHSH